MIFGHQSKKLIHFNHILEHMYTFLLIIHQSNLYTIFLHVYIIMNIHKLVFTWGIKCLK